MGTEEEQNNYDDALIFRTDATHFRHLPIVWRRVREKATNKSNKPWRVPIWRQTRKIVHAEIPYNGVLPATFLGTNNVKALEFPRNENNDVVGDDDLFHTHMTMAKTPESLTQPKSRVVIDAGDCLDAAYYVANSGARVCLLVNAAH